MSEDAAVVELTDPERVLLGLAVELAGANVETRFALFVHDAQAAANLASAGQLSTERARQAMMRRAAELKLTDDLDARGVIDAYLRAAGSGARMPVLDLEDGSSWEAWADAWLKPRGQRVGRMLEIRPGARGSGSFVSILMTQVSLARLAELCPAASPWQSLVLAVQELSEARKVSAELERAQRTIRQLRGRVAELSET